MPTEEEIVGATVYVQRGEEELKGHVLLKRTRKEKQEFYIHYVGYNKRLDEWVSESRLLLSRGVTREEEGEAAAAEANSKQNGHAPRNVPSGPTHGSLAENHSEMAKVRNINKVIFGKHEIEPWYFSPYPERIVMEDCIYICEYSLQYFGSLQQFQRFRSKYTLRHPPGQEIYRDEKFSFFEIDGRLQRTWCRNLSLLSKLFLDHKALQYDVDPFLFYCMTTRDKYGHNLVGYFSKEKESASGYNVACILSLPPYQRFGYGKVLIDFSYNLSKKENKCGSPEKPLSDLGLISYLSFWSDVLIEILVESNKSDFSIEELSRMTAFTTRDIMFALKTHDMVRLYKGQYVIYISQTVIDRYERKKTKPRHRIDPDKLIWKPPVFTASQLRFAW